MDSDAPSADSAATAVVIIRPLPISVCMGRWLRHVEQAETGTYSSNKLPERRYELY